MSRSVRTWARVAALSTWLVVWAGGCGGGPEAERVRTIAATDTVTATETETVTVPAQTGTVRAPAPEPKEAKRSSQPITRTEAVVTARRSASEYLSMAGIGFDVRPEDWLVSCLPREGGTVWDCRVEQGPCAGTLEVRRVTIGGQIRGVGEVACVGD